MLKEQQKGQKAEEEQYSDVSNSMKAPKMPNIKAPKMPGIKMPKL